jgi:oxygen-independent coproporphyrinogen III oxidase
MKRLGIYVQVPFCQTKCSYCNFHTGVVATERFAPYVEAVCKEIRQHPQLLSAAGVDWHGCLGRGSAAALQGENGPAGASSEGFLVDTVYFGGGTPSLLEAGYLKEIVEEVRRAFRTALEEVTLEADPETVKGEKATAWVGAGINRVSFGVQSFSDKELKAAGRMHRRTDIYRSVPILRAAGIRNISFDLIAGLPHQTRGSWKESLAELVAVAPEHVSVYLLEVDEGSRLGRELLGGGTRYSAAAVPSEDEMAEFYEMAQQALGAAGYRHYEISNWAKPGFRSKHNLKYWRREAYLGFGAGAHSFSGKQRWANAHDAAAYVGAIEGGRLLVEQLETVTPEQALDEELFLGLRQLDGIDVARIEREYGVTLRGRLEPLAAAGLLERDGNVVRLAEDRLSVSNEVFVELMNIATR